MYQGQVRTRRTSSAVRALVQRRCRHQRGGRKRNRIHNMHMRFPFQFPNQAVGSSCDARGRIDARDRGELDGPESWSQICTAQPKLDKRSMRASRSFDATAPCGRRSLCSPLVASLSCARSRAADEGILRACRPRYGQLTIGAEHRPQSIIGWHVLTPPQLCQTPFSCFTSRYRHLAPSATVSKIPKLTSDH